MASVTRRGRRWFAQVRRKGQPALYKTFDTKAAAQAWAREQEATIDRNQAPPDLRTLRQVTLGDVIGRYLTDVTPTKRSQDSERLRLSKLLRHPIADLTLADLSPARIAAYRDERLTQVKPATVRRELSLIHHALHKADQEWGYHLAANPVGAISQPKLNNARDRRLGEGELERLRAALASTKNELIEPIILIAIETALRRSEILAIEWKHVDLQQRTLHIPWSKTGAARTIPLTDAAIRILKERMGDGQFGRVFPISPNAFRLAWERARRRAGLVDLRFHDLRHEAISRFCELGLSVPEVSVISGHRDPRMLFRYAHIRPADLALKIAQMTSGAERRAA